MSNDWEEKAPAFQFYARDWITDTNLRRCSRAARSVWVDALCFMWLSPVKGRLEYDSREELCSVLGGGPELSPLIDELINKEVASSEGPGSLISRRMFAQAKLKQTRQKVGSLGGRKRVENLRAKEISSSKEPSKKVANSSSSSASATAVPVQAPDPVHTKAPIVAGCVYFRMSESDLVNVQNKYREKGFPMELIPEVVSEVDRWLGTDNPKAIKARASKTHALRCYDSWAIENALKNRGNVKRANGPTTVGGVLKDQFGFIPSAAERERIRMDNERKAAIERHSQKQIPILTIEEMKR